MTNLEEHEALWTASIWKAVCMSISVSVGARCKHTEGQPERHKILSYEPLSAPIHSPALYL